VTYTRLSIDLQRPERNPLQEPYHIPRNLGFPQNEHIVALTPMLGKVAYLLKLPG
jgi:hypothetical protein